MAKIGRNQPCPCGSRKKYKQCCLVTDEAAAVAAREEQRRNAPPPPVRPPVPRWGPAVDDEDEPLEKMSNHTVDLILDGKLDEAERACQRLLDDFPDLPDGHLRLAQLLRARGELKRAAHHLRLAAAVARANHDDPDMPLSLEAEADEIDPPAS